MDKQHFVTLVMAGEQTLYRVARSMLRCAADQQDAVQEAVAKAWAKRHTLREEKYFATWLVRILVNECRGIHRRQARLVLREDWAETALGIREETNLQGINTLLDALPDRLRLPMVLYYIEGCYAARRARSKEGYLTPEKRCGWKSNKKGRRGK